MLTNALLILFLLLMIFIWGHYGLFSALLHLLATIAAGALALAIWEPLTLGVFMHWFPDFAWGVGLFLPFLIFLLVIRTIMDRIVRSNMEFAIVANLVGGGVCGLLSGILTAGLMLIALGFLPLDMAIGGYRPLTVSAGGFIEVNQTLWPRVDRLAEDFYAHLSGGSFSSRKPMHVYAPDLARQADLFRLRVDENATVAAHPAMVETRRFFKSELPLKNVDPAIADPLKPPDSGEPHVLLVVEVQVNGTDRKTVPPYDADRRVRITPAQVRLGTHRASSQHGLLDARLHAPDALVEVNDVGRRLFQAIDSRNISADSSSDRQITAWAFIVPEGRRPSFLMFRHLRLPLPDIDDAITGEQEVKDALGEIPREEETDGATPDGRPTRPTERFNPGLALGDLEVTSDLPIMISREKSSRLRIERSLVMSGHDTVLPPRERVKSQDQVKGLYFAVGQTAVRVKLDRDRLHSLIGQALALAARVSGIYLVDNHNSQHAPVAYVLRKPGGAQEINYLNLGSFRSANQLPIKEMGNEDALYLYFAVPSGRSIVEARVANRTSKISPHLQLD